jgi:peptidyl-prolyl cis-trans isomerase D
MEFLRNAAKTWVAKVLMALLVLSFGVWGIKDVSSSFLNDILSFSGFGPKDLVHVGSKTIMADEYTSAVQRQLKQISAQTGTNMTLDEAHKLGLDKQVLDNLIAGAAVDVAAKKLNLAISDKVINESIFSNKAFQDPKGNFDASRFRQILAQNNYNEANFVAVERQSKLRATLTALADGNQKLPATLNTAIAQYRGEMRDTNYFNFVATEKDVTPPTDADLKKQYEATPTAYTAPEFRSVAIMKVDPEDIAAKATISAEELSAGYEKMKQDYFSPEKRTVVQLTFPNIEAAKKVKDRLTAGEDILKIAAELKLKGSDITLKDRQIGDFLDEKIAEATFKLPKDGVSDAIQGSLAIAIVKVTNIVPEKQSTLEEVKPDLTKRLQLEKAREEIQSVYNAVEDARGDQQTKFEDIAKKIGIPFQLVPAVNAAGVDVSGKDVAIAHKEDVIKAAYLSDVGNQDDAISIGDGYVWYEVRGVTPSTLKSFDVVKDEVKKDYVAGKIRDAASDKAKKLVERARAGASLEDLAKELAVPTTIATGLKRNETSEVFDGAAVISLFNEPDQGFAWSLEGDGKTARVMQVTKIVMPNVTAASPEAKTLQDEASAGLGRDLSETFIQAMRANAIVQVNQDLWQQNTGAAYGTP